VGLKKIVEDKEIFDNCTIC